MTKTDRVKKRAAKVQGVRVTDANWNYFLSELAIDGNVTRSAKASNVSRMEAYCHRDEDEEFAKAWRAAEDRGVEGLIDEARRRAHDGVERPVYQGGKKVGTVLDHSDTLLMFLVKAKRPEYRDKSVEVNLTMDLAGRVRRAGEKLK